jgi:hypothetical protein
MRRAANFLACVLTVITATAASGETLDAALMGTTFSVDRTFTTIDITGSHSFTSSERGVSGAFPGTLQLFSGSDSDGLFHSEFQTRGGWFSFNVPTGIDVFTSATFTADYTNQFSTPNPVFLNQIGLSELPAPGTNLSGAAAQPVINDVADGRYASFSVNNTSPLTLSTSLSGSILSDLLAHEGGLLYIGLTGGANMTSVFVSNARLTFESVPNVPIPAAGWLFGSALLAGLGIHKRSRKAAADLPA